MVTLDDKTTANLSYCSPRDYYGYFLIRATEDPSVRPIIIPNWFLPPLLLGGATVVPNSTVQLWVSL